MNVISTLYERYMNVYMNENFYYSSIINLGIYDYHF